MDRRTLLRTSVQLALLAPFARIAHALPNADARFVIVILRGALDGLAAVAPYGEPQYKSLRGALALDSPGTTGGVLKLDGLFGLHPSLTSLHAMYQAKELAVSARGRDAVSGALALRRAEGARGGQPVAGRDRGRLAQSRARGAARAPAASATRSRSPTPCRSCCAATFR